MKSIEEIKKILKDRYREKEGICYYYTDTNYNIAKDYFKKCWYFFDIHQIIDFADKIGITTIRRCNLFISLPKRYAIKEINCNDPIEQIKKEEEEERKEKESIKQRDEKVKYNLSILIKFNIKHLAVEQNQRGIIITNIEDLLDFYKYINDEIEKEITNHNSFINSTKEYEKTIITETIPRPQQKENNSFVLVTNTNTITPTQQSKFATDETIRKYFTGTVEAWENLFNSKCIQPATEENGLQIQCLTKEKSKYKDLGALLLSLQELEIYRKAEKGQGKLPLYSKLEELNIFVDKEKEPIKKINRLTYTNKKRKKITITSFSKTLTIRNCSKNAEEILRTISNIKNLQEH